jgi:hypothetical protein
MARQRFSLIPEDTKQEVILESKIRNGEIHADNFHELDPEEQKLVQKILFKMASEKVEPNIGASCLEFVLFAFMRLMHKQWNGIPFNEDDKAIQESLQRIMNMHQITNYQIPKQDWFFDYMAYAEEKAREILKNREEHVQRKLQVIGEV